MKKFYLFLIMLLSVIAPQAADAFSITINVDDASRLNVFLNGYKELVNGDNVFEVNDGDYLSIYTKQDDIAIKSVFNGDKELKLENYSTFKVELTESEHTGAKFVVKTAPWTRCEQPLARLPLTMRQRLHCICLEHSLRCRSKTARMK